MMRITSVTKRFGPLVAINDLSFNVEDGELLVILGPSGCGKSSTLRIVAGLDNPDTGTVEIDGDNMSGVPAHQRDVALVFQSPQFLPNRTVAENIAYPLTCRASSWWSILRGRLRREHRKVVTEWAEKLSIGHLLDRDPGTLSGGELQRVSLARALVKNSRVLLLDEPLTGVDTRLRDDLLRELLEVKRAVAERQRGSIVYVTHDQEDAMLLGDRILVMDKGTLRQIGSPSQVYHDPQSLFVASFLGSPPMNIMPGTMRIGAGVVELRLLGVVLQIPKDRLRKQVPEGPAAPILVGIRPEDIHIRLGQDGKGKPRNGGGDYQQFAGKLVGLSDLGSRFVARLEAAGQPLSAVCSNHVGLPSEGFADVTMTIRIQSIRAFDQNSQTALL